MMTALTHYFYHCDSICIIVIFIEGSSPISSKRYVLLLPVTMNPLSLLEKDSSRKKKIILVSRSHCGISSMLTIINIMNERYLSEQVSLIVFHQNHQFSVISHCYLSHQSKYIRCGPLYLFKTSSCLYVKSLYPRCYPIYLILLSNLHLHRSTRVNRSLHNNELAYSPR